MKGRILHRIRVGLLIGVMSGCGVDDRELELTAGDAGSHDDGALASDGADSARPDGSRFLDGSRPADAQIADVSNDRAINSDAAADASDGCVPNACGGCSVLTASAGAKCGRCGKYVCRTDKTDVTCSDPGLNACGGCGDLSAAPGASCGQCGKYVCSSDNSTVACSDPGQNACGGCGVLGVAPGTNCGSCGIYACTSDKTAVACNGTGTNACGGCGTLAAAPNTSCGQCGTYACSPDKSSVSCSDLGINACGGCGALAAVPGALCGKCGKYVCSSNNAMVSCSDPGVNACGGCGTLAGTPGASCGTCGKYVCSADNSAVSCSDPGANLCGGCGALAGTPNAACGACGKYVCSVDKISVSCSDTTCGTCQVCSAPLSCSTLPLYGLGQCSSTQYCDGTGPSCVACPLPASASALHFVDPAYGTDDANHGGAYGHCGYKTLTYALAHATGQIALQTATYSPSSGETFPIVLKGQQALLCKFTTASPATIQGKAKYDKIQISVSVAFEGTQNSLFNCIINGGGGTGYCVDVFSSGSAFPQTHLISTADIGNCGGSAVQVESGTGNLSVQSSTLRNSLLGVFWAGSNAGGTMQNNSFSANTTDIQCSGADTGVTGSGNHASAGGSPSCVTCGNCPF
jgi:hypothetical protein